jgi:hypothetical protein
VDAGGNVYVTGWTVSTQATFPVTVGPDLTHNGDLDAFVAKVNAAGTALLYAGYIGGAVFDNGEGIAVDAAGNAYVTGNTGSTEATFPVTAGPDLSYNGGVDAFVAKVNAAGTALVYAGYIGGSDTFADAGSGLAVDGAGNAYVTGITNSTDFPVTVGPDLTFNGPVFDAFVAKIGADVITVAIDIKPGSSPNSINLGSQGTVPVAIFSAPAPNFFDATTVDPTSVSLAGASVALKGKGTPMASVQDVNGDGLLDLVVHVSTEGLQLTGTDTQAILTGLTFSGQQIQGSDSVRIVP